MSSLADLIDRSHLITFIGTGGVGKTSLSLATALQAGRRGKKVAAITVDPSKRLSRILGLDEHGAGKLDSENMSGQIDVFHIDPQQVFQEFVSSHMSADLYAKLKSNGIYRQISKNLRETHNFAALYKMSDIFDSNQYDLIVLDTPPCHQVVEFLQAPSRLQKFFSGKEEKEKAGWVSWIQNKSLQVTETFLKTLVGKEFVEEMDKFFQMIGALKSEIYRVTDNFLVRMADEKSNLLLVFPPALDKYEDALYLTSEIEKNQFKIDHFVMNRAYPIGLDLGKELPAETDESEKKLYNYFQREKLQSLQLMSELKKKNNSQEVSFSVLPELKMQVESAQDVLDFAETIEKAWESV